MSANMPGSPRVLKVGEEPPRLLPGSQSNRQVKPSVRRTSISAIGSPYSMHSPISPYAH